VLPNFYCVIRVLSSSLNMNHWCKSLQLIAMRTTRPPMSQNTCELYLLIWATVDLRISLSGSPCRTSCFDRTTSTIPSHPPSCREMAAPHAASSG
jgi:hypothetical protein